MLSKKEKRQSSIKTLNGRINDNDTVYGYNLNIVANRFNIKYVICIYKVIFFQSKLVILGKGIVHFRINQLRGMRLHMHKERSEYLQKMNLWTNFSIMISHLPKVRNKFILNKPNNLQETKSKYQTELS